MKHGKSIVSVALVAVSILISGISVAHEPQSLPNKQWAWVSGAAVPVQTKLADQAPKPIITANSAIVIDAATAAPLFELNPEVPLPPASTTKLMTALVARKTFDLEKVITITQEAFTQGTTMGLVVGENITVRNLLSGLLITSGNDAAFALANAHPKGYTGFIADMNTEAQQLNLDLTHFNNPSGLDEENHRTTAKDLATITRKVMEDPVLRDIAGTNRAEIYDVTGEVLHSLQHTHQLVGSFPGVVGVKTGTTPLAGEVLITEWDPFETDYQWRPFIIVIMNSQDRYADTTTLLEWTKNNYHWRNWSELSTLVDDYGK